MELIRNSTYQQKFNEKILELEKFIFKNGKLPTTNEKKLYRWITRTKTKYRNNKLSDDEILSIENLEIIFLEP